MNKRTCVSAVLALACVALSTAALATSNPNIVVTNNTQYTLTELYASSSSAPSWGTTNLISGQSIAPGQQTTIYPSSGEDDCSFDLMGVLYGAANHAYQYSVDACHGGGGSWAISQ